MSEDEARKSTAEPRRVLSWRGKTVGLSAVEAQDAELIHLWRSDAVAAHEIGFWPGSLAAVRERIERDQDSSDDVFLILLPDSTPVGRISLVNQDLADGSAEIHLVMGAEYRGQGYGTDALDALIDLAFGELPLHRLEAITHTDNTAALAVLAKSGFVQEGVRRSACMHRGRRYDLAGLALLRPEWEAMDRPRSWELN
jgi:RimJ/RimL family protein N-acetyltransferase